MVTRIEKIVKNEIKSTVVPSKLSHRFGQLTF